jgi:signal transduction histidine kinase
MLSREVVWNALNDARQSQSLCIDEFRVVSGDEAVRWVTADAQFHRDATCDADRTLRMAVETTDRKRTEEKLRESEETPAGNTGSCIDVTERKMAEEALSGVIGRLIAVQEEERKRIAREIHDDYNQRLAMLAIDVEELAEQIGNSPADAGERLFEIWNGISELGADLHSLSHSLHSSTLESLGLIEGARAFCEEFAGQQRIQVDFAHENVPPDVPEEAALCLFRIVQESLRNVKRHSGADTAEVRLEASGEKLHLSVADRGMGFHVSQRSSRDGIGIRSMEERLRSLGGCLEIDSRPMEGTRIDAWLPLNGAAPRATSERRPQAVTRSENVESRRQVPTAPFDRR